MAILKFRIYVEEDNGIYRDVVIKTGQNFEELHKCILQSYGFDAKHQATFYRSNDGWQKGRQISLESYADRQYRVDPLLMAETKIRTEIQDTNQHFIYEYDFKKNWIFLIELIGISKDVDTKATYPYVSRTEGVGPQQYGTKNLLTDQFVDIEEKYDLEKNPEGFGQEGTPDSDEMEEQSFDTEGDDI